MLNMIIISVIYVYKLSPIMIINSVLCALPFSARDMNAWALERKVAATLTLFLLFTRYLAGVANVFVKVGMTPSEVERRYAPAPASTATDLESFLEETPPPVTMEKLIFIAHAHLIPYTLIFALLSFFVLFLSWTSGQKIIFMTLFATVIVADIASIFATHTSFTLFFHTL